MRQLINHFTDNDAYTFSCQYYILKTYPRAEVEYNFFDRNKTKYPKGFAELLQEQVNYMENVVITDEEIAFMSKNMYYLPLWYFTFLKGYRFNPKEVAITQDDEGYLDISVKGKWFSTIMWEMPLLSCISELTHILNGDVDRYDFEHEYRKSYNKMLEAIKNGLVISDMGTRRRFSYQHHDNVIRSFVEASKCTLESLIAFGKFVGTSNVWFAMKYGLTPIGTMSHQIISFEETVSGIFECNNQVMSKWSECYDGLNGTYLYDCFGDKVFFNNFQTKYAKLFDGLRVDSGDEFEQTEKIIDKYKSSNIDAMSKSIVYSNGLDLDKALDIHKFVNYRLKDSYGIGTFLTCDIDNAKPSNIVIKLVKGRITEQREWHDCVKLSCNSGKTLGNQEKCNYLLNTIESSPL
jgi:nicotinate phosphoribosyltransferase